VDAKGNARAEWTEEAIDLVYSHPAIKILDCATMALAILRDRCDSPPARDAYYLVGEARGVVMKAELERLALCP